MRIAVTGAAGYIGRALISQLKRDGHTVAGIDSFESINSQRPAIHGDVTTDDFWWMRGAEVVVHLAARVSVVDSVKDPAEDARVNVLGTIRTAQAALDAGVGRFVFASTCAVYGENDHAAVGDELRPLSPYGIGKKAAEEYLRWFTTRGLSVSVLRFGNVYGGDDRRGIWPIFRAAKAAGKAATIYGDGSATRSYVDVSEVVRAVIAECESKSTWCVRNVTGRAYTAAEIANEIGVTVTHADHRSGEARACALA